MNWYFEESKIDYKPISDSVSTFAQNSDLAIE